MKTTTFSISLCLALLGSGLSNVQAALPTQTMFVLFGATTPGQTATPQQEADGLLASARRSMNDGKYDLADSYIDRAEKLNPQYGAAHFGDTPQKLRSELRQKQGTVIPATGIPGAGVPTTGYTAPAFPATSSLLPSATSTPMASSPSAPSLLPGNNDPLPRSNAFGASGSSAAPLPYVNIPNNNTPASVAPYKTDSATTGGLRQPSITPPGFAMKYDNMVTQAGNTTTESGSPSTGNSVGFTTPSLSDSGPLGYQAPASIGSTSPASSKPLAPAPSAGYMTGTAYGSGNASAGSASPLNAAPSFTAPASVPSSPIASTPSSFQLAQNTGAPATLPSPSSASEYMQKGEASLRAGKSEEALQFFNLARDNQSDLDTASRERLQSHLQMLSKAQAPRPQSPDLLTGAASNQNVLAAKISAELTRVQTEATKMKAQDPRRALALLEQTKAKYTSAPDLDATLRQGIQRRLDLSINDINKYISENASQISLDERNKEVRQDVDASKQKRIETDTKLVNLIEDFNRLVDEHRFGEAVVVAKKAKELAPDNPVVQQLWHQANMLSRMNEQQQIAGERENAIYGALTDVDRAAKPSEGDYVHGMSPTEWKHVSGSREKWKQENLNRRSPREKEIEQRLMTPVMAKFENRPLREVINYFEKVANINIHPDPQGFQVESITLEQPVTLTLMNEIPLRSALKLLLGPLKLNYVIKNDVLMITSQDMTRGNVYQVVYPVADLVIPIPNFAPTGNEGMVGPLQKAFEQANLWRAAGPGGWKTGGLPMINTVATGQNADPAKDPSHLAQTNQQMNRGLFGNNNGPQTGQPQSIPFGPTGMGGGGAEPDFESLIQLIQTTVQPKSWKENSGDDSGGTIDRYETNLSLVVRNTQEVHEELADLLQQLRRLQDLQVTIEVRFVTLSDNFFERIGIDFDFSIDDNVSFAGLNQDSGPSSVIGLGPTGDPTPALNLQFMNGSFTSGTVPSFPGLGFDPATAGTFGFAILSDIEAFFLINAAQGDSRSNILQAPKVTLFNGQTAFVSDFTQRPFVASVIPVVGDFAIGQQPVIVVLGEGTTLTVQAVVSNDRRFVRLTVVPFFSQIDDVEEFTFTGTRTSTSKSSDATGADDAKSSSKEVNNFTEGVTIQRPTFSVVSVNTTVSVPDGGTVLLGGIKRLSEGRNERGIPILSKLPYINRLFKNVGIGRTTQSLMIMVTPRIIIQEEEEEKLIGSTPAGS